MMGCLACLTGFLLQVYVSHILLSNVLYVGMLYPHLDEIASVCLTLCTVLHTCV